MEIRPRHHFGNSWAIEEMGVALNVRQDQGSFPFRLADKLVCGASHQAIRCITILHQLEQRRHPIRGQGEIFPHGSKVMLRRFFMRHTEHDKTGQKGLSSSFQCGLPDYPAVSTTSASASDIASSLRPGLFATSRSSEL